MRAQPAAWPREACAFSLARQEAGSAACVYMRQAAETAAVLLARGGLSPRVVRTVGTVRRANGAQRLGKAEPMST